jgi:hypothetical protein
MLSKTEQMAVPAARLQISAVRWYMITSDNLWGWAMSQVGISGTAIST